MKQLPLIFFLSVFFVNQAHTNDLTNWIFSTKGRIYSTPAIVDDFVLFGSGDSCFYALSRLSGAEIWNYKTGGAIFSSPVVRDSLVFFGSADGNLYALNIQNGKLLWKFESKGETMLDLWDYFLSSPIETNGIIYWGSGDGHLYAVNAENGNLVWKYKANGPIHATPLIADNKVYIGDYGGYFFALNAETGQLIWQFRTIGDTYFPNGEIQIGATIDNGIVFFGSRDYNIYALDSQTGRGHWNMKEIGSWIIAKPLVYNNFVYFGTSDTHRFYCLSKANGKIIWQIPLPMRVYGSAIEHNEIIYFGCFDGILRGVDFKTGEIAWQFETDGSKKNYANIFNSNGQFVEGFELYGNDYLESERLIHTLGSILSSPVIVNNTIYFGSSDGSLYSVNLN